MHEIHTAEKWQVGRRAKRLSRLTGDGHGTILKNSDIENCTPFVSIQSDGN
jgi:hypothetical protein